MLSKLRKNMKWILIAVAVIFAATMFYGMGYQGVKNMAEKKSQETGLAEVNKEPVDRFRFNQLLNQLASSAKGGLDPLTAMYIQSMALSQLTDFTLMKQDASKSEKVSSDEIKNALSQIMTANKIQNEKDFDRGLRQQGFSLADLKKMIKEEILVQKKTSRLREGITLNADDLREVRAQHILLPDEKKAKEVLGLVNSGKDFSKLAEEYSKDPGSAVKGGDLGFFKKGAMVKEFDETAFSLKPGQTSGLVKTQFGYHIIKVTDTKLIKNPDKEKLLEEKKKASFASWLEELRAKAKIEIKDPAIRAFDKRVKGDTLGSVAEYKKAIDGNPNNPYYRIFYADLMKQLGSPGEAASQYQKAADLSGNDLSARLFIGKSLLDMAKSMSNPASAEAYNSMARNQFSMVSVLAGDNIDVHKELAKVFKELKLPDQLKAENEKISQLEAKKAFEDEIRKRSGVSTVEAK